MKHNLNPCGFPEFYSHDNLYYSSEDETDDDYEITLTVKKLWKEYKEDAVDGNVFQTLTMLDTKVDNNNKQLLQRLEKLERSMESLQLQGCMPDKKPKIISSAGAAMTDLRPSAVHLVRSRSYGDVTAWRAT